MATVMGEAMGAGGAGPRGGRSPLWAVLAFSWVSSLGTGLTTNGIYYMTKHGYGFPVWENYALGLAGGMSYIVGALSTGPLLRALRRMGLSTRDVLGGLLGLLGVLCFTPLVFAPAAGERPAHWPMWVLMTAYQPLCGVLWPVIESYLSGGRSGRELRSALGRWNITWCSAVVAALWASGPMIEHHAPALLAGMGISHWLSAFLLVPMGAEPGVHLEDEHEPHPPVYARLLGAFRVLLPLGYMVSTALTPYLPTALSSLGVKPAWQTPLGATWTVSRVVLFVLLERWHGWHGKWWPAAAAVILLLGGFGTAVLSPHLGDRTLGVAVMLLGLAAFGAGMATTYTGSLYYAMEVERADVEAGSRHEALIGVGYTVGPACGLGAVLCVPAGSSADVVMLGLVGVISVSVVAGAALRTVRQRTWGEGQGRM